MKARSYYEFFAGGGMARAGLGQEWTCLFANDIDAKKAASYAAIAELTVKLHVSHVLEKLNVKDRTEAATAGLQRGIISLG